MAREQACAPMEHSRQHGGRGWGRRPSPPFAAWPSVPGGGHFEDVIGVGVSYGMDGVRDGAGCAGPCPPGLRPPPRAIRPFGQPAFLGSANIPRELCTTSEPEHQQTPTSWGGQLSTGRHGHTGSLHHQLGGPPRQDPRGERARASSSSALSWARSPGLALWALTGQHSHRGASPGLLRGPRYPDSAGKLPADDPWVITRTVTQGSCLSLQNTG